MTGSFNIQLLMDSRQGILSILVSASLLEDLGINDLTNVSKKQLVSLLSKLALNDIPGSVGVFQNSQGEILTLADLIRSGAIETPDSSSITASESLDVRLILSLGVLGLMGLTGAVSEHIKDFFEAVSGLILNDSNSSKHDGVVSVTDSL